MNAHPQPSFYSARQTDAAGVTPYPPSQLPATPAPNAGYPPRVDTMTSEYNGSAYYSNNRQVHHYSLHQHPPPQVSSMASHLASMPPISSSSVQHATTSPDHVRSRRISVATTSTSPDGGWKVSGSSISHRPRSNESWKRSFTVHARPAMTPAASYTCLSSGSDEHQSSGATVIEPKIRTSFATPAATQCQSYFSPTRIVQSPLDQPAPFTTPYYGHNKHESFVGGFVLPPEAQQLWNQGYPHSNSWYPPPANPYQHHVTANNASDTTGYYDHMGPTQVSATPAPTIPVSATASSHPGSDTAPEVRDGTTSVNTRSEANGEKNKPSSSSSKFPPPKKRQITVQSINKEHRVWIDVAPNETGASLAEKIHVIATFRTRKVLSITTASGRSIPLNKRPVFSSWSDLESFEDGEQWHVEWGEIDRSVMDRLLSKVVHVGNGQHATTTRTTAASSSSSSSSTISANGLRQKSSIGDGTSNKTK